VMIEGMMCEHCEARIVKALSQLEGVRSVSADHHSGIATVEHEGELDPASVRKAIEDADYVYSGIKGKDERKMEKTLKIEGMMCMHCEATVRKALEAVEGVEKAEVSHEKGTAVVTLSKEVSNEVLKAAVEAKDYPVLEVR
ncbi:MAG: copper ion binding protein, partial [Erysipelotrichaceae bacterium]|nr:copper ion binding protein [Erysipelotrichaceae bacterium]